ncbi:MAG: hypothetical protein H7338_02470 [Candidatus Sericytochromatia bacterium]|nr:hypothetical protein [Candidatus Sericytochromatia bacterium]
MAARCGRRRRRQSHRLGHGRGIRLWRRQRRNRPASLRPAPGLDPHQRRHSQTCWPSTRHQGQGAWLHAQCACRQDPTEALGFQTTNYASHGQPVFRNGNRFITPDVDSHRGGAWKMAEPVLALGSKSTRLGTDHAALNRPVD